MLQAYSKYLQQIIVLAIWNYDGKYVEINITKYLNKHKWVNQVHDMEGRRVHPPHAVPT